MWGGGRGVVRTQVTDEAARGGRWRRMSSRASGPHPAAQPWRGRKRRKKTGHRHQAPTEAPHHAGGNNKKNGRKERHTEEKKTTSPPHHTKEQWIGTREWGRPRTSTAGRLLPARASSNMVSRPLHPATAAKTRTARSPALDLAPNPRDPQREYPRRGRRATSSRHASHPHPTKTQNLPASPAT